MDLNFGDSFLQRMQSGEEYVAVETWLVSQRFGCEPPSTSWIMLHISDHTMTHVATHSPCKSNMAHVAKYSPCQSPSTTWLSIKVLALTTFKPNMIHVAQQKNIPPSFLFTSRIIFV